MTASDSDSARAAEPDQRSVSEALANGGLDIWYQPKIDLKRKCLAGAEALVRLHHPADDAQWPEPLLAAATDDEKALVIQHALLAIMQHWSSFAEAGFNLHLALNVSAHALTRVPIAKLVEEHRPSSKHWPGLILEIAEDQFIRDIKQTQKITAELKAAGVAVTIDDFGAGYSSFASLREIPFAEIKIDSSFVKNCATDVTNAAICQTAIDLAHRFGSVAVADGIETMSDMQSLVVMGCDFGQGALMAPPMPKDSFLELLRQRLNKPRAPAAPAPAAGRVA